MLLPSSFALLFFFLSFLLSHFSFLSFDTYEDLLITESSYLIVDYERTEFSIHQCRFHEDSDPIIRTIHSTNTTKFNVPLNSQKDHANRNLSPGAIGGILVAALMTVTIGALIYWGCHRRRVVSAQSSEPSKAPDYIEPTIPELQEHSDPLWKIGGQPRPIPELHGKCNSLPELRDTEPAAKELPE